MATVRAAVAATEARSPWRSGIFCAFGTLLRGGLAFSSVVAAIACGVPSRAADLVLASPGVAPAPIILFQDAPPRTREAAVLLADYIEKISGVRPAVREGEPQVVPGRAIWVGFQPAVKRLFPQTDFTFRQPEEILLAANESHLVIAGRDRWDPARMEGMVRRAVVKGLQQEYGTVNAVYTFIQEHLGVRWLWPGELGEDWSPRRHLAVAPFEYRHAPQMRARGSAFVFSSLGSGSAYGQSSEWLKRQRLQLDSLMTYGGHAFDDWWERFHARHPEIFALQPDGTRSGYPTPRTAKLCVTNPKVAELWLADVAGLLAKDPNRAVFNVSTNDGWYSGHCVCAACRAWDHPDGEPREYRWKDRTAQGPALTDREVTFANQLAALLEGKYPGRGYRVELLSYGNSRPVPVGVRPADNVIMSIVANFLGRTTLVDRGSSRGDTYRQQFEAWAKVVPAMIWRPNTGSPAGWQQGLPDLSTQQTIRDLKDVAAANGVGIFIDSTWEHWATQGPQYYIMAQLIWNPAADADALLVDYYERAFGPAAAPVREYFEALERARMAFTERRAEGGVFTFPRLYTEALLRDSQARLERAAAAVPAGSLPARRVAFVQAGLTYTRLTMENARLMARYWTAKDEALASRVRRNWTAIEELIAAHPVALNWGPIRPQTPRMLGLHPDHPNPKLRLPPPGDLDLN